VHERTPKADGNPKGLEPPGTRPRAVEVNRMAVYAKTQLEKHPPPHQPEKAEAGNVQIRTAYASLHDFNLRANGTTPVYTMPLAYSGLTPRYFGPKNTTL
jgi:hypothetical protein